MRIVREIVLGVVNIDKGATYVAYQQIKRTTTENLRDRVWDSACPDRFRLRRLCESIAQYRPEEVM